MQISLVFSLLALAIAYNAWVFLRPSVRTPKQNDQPPLLASVQVPGPTVTGEPAVEIVDPRTIPPAARVDFTRAPEWPRNPFVNAFLSVPDVTPAPVRVAEPELVVASILHSSRRRFAIINGQIKRVGDRIGSSTIRDIEPRAVVVESASGARQTIELRLPLADTGGALDAAQTRKAPAVRGAGR
jgi:hypothetical protein